MVIVEEERGERVKLMKLGDWERGGVRERERGGRRNNHKRNWK